jgi:hypothetical protein
MTELYIVREYNGGTQFKPQKVYALKNYFTQWFYTYEDCLEECELRSANVLLETTTDLDVLKKKVRLLEDKKQRLIAAGLHPESRKLYWRFPDGWPEMNIMHPEIQGFGWCRGTVRAIRIEAGNDIGPGFIYDIIAPANAVDCRLRIGTMTPYVKIIGGRIRFMNPTPNVKRIDVYVRCTDKYRGFGNPDQRRYLKDMLLGSGFKVGKTDLMDWQLAMRL